MLSGTPTATGTFSFSVVLTDAGGSSMSRSYQLRVSNLNITDPGVIPVQATRSLPYTYTFTATGGGSPKTFSVLSGSLNGLTLSSAGVLSGTPSSRGMFTIQVQVSDGTVAFSKYFTLYVNEEVPDVLDAGYASTFLGDLSAGQSVALWIDPAGGRPPYTVSLASGSTLPPGLRLVGGAGLLPGASAGRFQLVGVASTPGQYTVHAGIH